MDHHNSRRLAAQNSSFLYFKEGLNRLINQMSTRWCWCWHSDSGYGGATDVSLNCGRFYGPVIRPRMNEWVNEWMDVEEIFFFFFFCNFRKCGTHGGMILTGKTEGLWENPVPMPLYPPQIPLDWPGREPRPPRWEKSRFSDITSDACRKACFMGTIENYAYIILNYFATSCDFNGIWVI
jgi:hypothetical protein